MHFFIGYHKLAVMRDVGEVTVSITVSVTGVFLAEAIVTMVIPIRTPTKNNNDH